MHEEGIGIPPLKLYKAGDLNQDILDTIRYNVRVPDMVVGDLFAQVAALEISGARLVDFMSETGMGDLRDVGAPIQDLGERAMRRAIAELPDGSYEGVTYLDGYDQPLKIQATITVRGDEIDVDFTGTSDQVDGGGINVPYNYTQAYTTYPLKCLLDPHTTRTSGSFRPITVRAPEGCILNCRYPAAVNARTLTGDTICNVVFMGLADVLPHRVIAESGTTPPLRIFVSGIARDDTPSPSTSSPTAAWAPGPPPTASTAPLPHQHPVRLHGGDGVGGSPAGVEEGAGPGLGRPRALHGRPGPGHDHGGGLRQAGDPLGHLREVGLSPLGRAGGMAARANRAEKVMGEGPLPRKGRTQLLPGDVINLSFAGGGGYGPPAERDPAQVKEDLRDGLISEARARSVFGLDADPPGTAEVETSARIDGRRPCSGRIPRRPRPALPSSPGAPPPPQRRVHGHERVQGGGHGEQQGPDRADPMPPDHGHVAAGHERPRCQSRARQPRPGPRRARRPR